MSYAQAVQDRARILRAQRETLRRKRDAAMARGQVDRAMEHNTAVLALTRRIRYLTGKE